MGAPDRWAPRGRICWWARSSTTFLLSSNLRELAHTGELAAERVARRRQIIGRLQVEPIFRRLTERLAEQQRQVGADRPCASDDMGYPHRRHADRTRKCGLRDADLAENLGKKFTRMNGRQLALHVLSLLY